MSHALPPVGHPARDLFDVAHLAAIGTGAEPLLTLPGALRQARSMFADNVRAAGVRRLAYIVLRAESDQVELISVGPRGGWRREWRFGPVPRTARLA